MPTTSPRRMSPLLIATAFVLAACGGSSEPTRPPSLALHLEPASATVTQGAATTTTLTVARTNLSDDVTVSASGLPAGVTVAFAPAVLTGGATTSTMTVTASASAAPATVSLTITASNPAISPSTAQLLLTIAPFRR